MIKIKWSESGSTNANIRNYSAEIAVPVQLSSAEFSYRLNTAEIYFKIWLLRRPISKAAIDVELFF